MTKRIKSWLVNLTLLGVSFTFCLGALEIGARLYVEAADVQRRTQKEFRLTQPEPYQQATYFNENFIDESFTQPGGWDTPEGTSLILPHDFAGEYFNVKDERRVTTNQPKAYDGRILVFGGSTVYNSEVPDSWTLPSSLQRILPHKKVENYGASSYTSSQQLERLKREKVQAGDVVVFFDGVNDVTRSIFQEIPTQSLVDYNRYVRDQSFFNKLMIWMDMKSTFVRYFFNFYNTDLPAHIADAQELKRRTKLAADLYARNIQEAHNYVIKNGGNFYHFLQPTLYTSGELTLYEEKLAANPFFSLVGWKEASLSAYPAFRDVVKELSEQDIRTFDITHAFVARHETGEEIFFDACHVNHKGNQYLAEKISSYIK